MSWRQIKNFSLIRSDLNIMSDLWSGCLKNISFVELMSLYETIPREGMVFCYNSDDDDDDAQKIETKKKCIWS